MKTAGMIMCRGYAARYDVDAAHPPSEVLLRPVTSAPYLSEGEPRLAIPPCYAS